MSKKAEVSSSYPENYSKFYTVLEQKDIALLIFWVDDYIFQLEETSHKSSEVIKMFSEQLEGENLLNSVRIKKLRLE